MYLLDQYIHVSHSITLFRLRRGPDRTRVGLDKPSKRKTAIRKGRARRISALSRNRMTHLCLFLA